ncbi:hypothetical protein [Aureimonas jatrophae]|uniref:Type III secretion low calcium response chaperone LcrH/SycD n=1 Tax=Aureimonas jatrophae TaxID=1166073 RepID=A0A1H0ESM5_9HYPH|nr:hypothetical protein [Aureimonas jatrophae]MBB3950337.1 hypothetical protein [Aureimonas jatrophae]SDN85316.1 hypothetical protein SAMN05192530_102198 [Aureimonas jatrophae]
MSLDATGTGTAGRVGGIVQEGRALQSSSLGAVFALDAAESALLLELVGETLRAEGIEPSTILSALARGQGIGASLGLSANSLEVLYARAHGWFHIDRLDRAEALFRVLCIADGSVADYWIGHGVCLRARDDVAGALIAFQMAAVLRPDWAVCQFHLASLAVRRRDAAATAVALNRFEALANVDTPSAMRTEAKRLRAAIDLGRDA